MRLDDVASNICQALAQGIDAHVYERASAINDKAGPGYLLFPNGMQLGRCRLNR
jgi:hypothetical protein